MKVIRRSEQAFYDQAVSQHDELLAEHRAQVDAVHEHNAEMQATHEAHVERLREHHEQAVERFEERKLAVERATAAAEARRVKALERREKVERENAKLRRKVFGKLAEVRVPEVVPLTLGEPPGEFEEPEEPPLQVEPEEPEFAHDPPVTYTVREVEGPPEPGKPGAEADEQAVDYEAFIEVETAWGKTIAQAGDKVLVNDRTGEAHVVHPAEFERDYVEAA